MIPKLAIVCIALSGIFLTKAEESLSSDQSVFEDLKNDLDDMNNGEMLKVDIKKSPEFNLAVDQCVKKCKQENSCIGITIYAATRIIVRPGDKNNLAFVCKTGILNQDKSDDTSNVVLYQSILKDKLPRHQVLKADLDQQESILTAKNNPQKRSRRSSTLSDISHRDISAVQVDVFKKGSGSKDSELSGKTPIFSLELKGSDDVSILVKELSQPQITIGAISDDVMQPIFDNTKNVTSKTSTKNIQKAPLLKLMTEQQKNSLVNGVTTDVGLHLETNVAVLSGSESDGTTQAIETISFVTEPTNDFELDLSGPESLADHGDTEIANPNFEVDFQENQNAEVDLEISRNDGNTMQSTFSNVAVPLTTINENLSNRDNVLKSNLTSTFKVSVDHDSEKLSPNNTALSEKSSFKNPSFLGDQEVSNENANVPIIPKSDGTSKLSQLHQTATNAPVVQSLSDSVKQLDKLEVRTSSESLRPSSDSRINGGGSATERPLPIALKSSTNSSNLLTLDRSTESNSTHNNSFEEDTASSRAQTKIADKIIKGDVANHYEDWVRFQGTHPGCVLEDREQFRRFFQAAVYATFENEPTMVLLSRNSPCVALMSKSGKRKLVPRSEVFRGFPHQLQVSASMTFDDRIYLMDSSPAQRVWAFKHETESESYKRVKGVMLSKDAFLQHCNVKAPLDIRVKDLLQFSASNSDCIVLATNGSIYLPEQPSHSSLTIKKAIQEIVAKEFVTVGSTFAWLQEETEPGILYIFTTSGELYELNYHENEDKLSNKNNANAFSYRKMPYFEIPVPSKLIALNFRSLA